MVAFSTLLTSSAQIFYKKGAIKLPILLTNWELFFGLFLYGIAAAILIYALKNGELNVLYPIIATSFIWVTILSSFIFHETITYMKIIGVVFITIGITLIGIGSKSHKTQEKEWQQNSGQLH